jgi:hypothetical protein
MTQTLPELSKWRTGGNAPVIALDLDGTLGMYHEHFLWFAEQWLGEKMPSAEEVNPGLRLSTFMGVPHHIYRECKLAYRQGGLKRFMPAYPFADYLTSNIRHAGAEVWLCTTRPYLRLDNIDPDTREFLRRNHIQYDAVIFEGLELEEGGIGKYWDLVRQVGQDRIVAAVDDLPEQVSQALDSGIRKVYIRDQPYNRDPSITAERVTNLEELWASLYIQIKYWQEQHG